VHEARLRKGRNRGERVAVKVQRPNIESIIEVDLSVLDFFARFIHRFIPRAKIMNVPDIIDAFGTALRKEIDYILEGRNADKVAKIHKNDKTVAVPEIYWDYTSKRVLTMEFIEGIKISEVDEMDRAGLDRYEVTKNMLRAYMKQIFAEGFLHADPHPANLFVLEDEVICFLDFGMVEHLDDPLLDKLTDLLIAAIHDVDPAKTRDEFMRLHVGRREDVDSQRLLFGLASFMDRHFVDKKFPLSQRGVGYIMNDIVYEVYKYGIKLPLPLVLVIKTLLYCEMLANELYPGFDVMDMVKPHVNRRLRGKYRRKVDALGLTEPKDLVSDLLDAAKEAFDFAKDFPRQATAIMNKIERGEMEFKVTNNNHNNHLIWGIAISAIIITLLVVIILQI
jgi:ubiquinone biosynthesis protein